MSMVLPSVVKINIQNQLNLPSKYYLRFFAKYLTNFSGWAFVSGSGFLRSFKSSSISVAPCSIFSEFCLSWIFQNFDFARSWTNDGAFNVNIIILTRKMRKKVHLFPQSSNILVAKVIRLGHVVKFAKNDSHSPKQWTKRKNEPIIYQLITH